MPQKTKQQKTRTPPATAVAWLMLRAALACVTLGSSEALIAVNTARKAKEAAKEATKEARIKAAEAARIKDEEAAQQQAELNNNFFKVFIRTIGNYLDMPNDWQPAPTTNCTEDRTAEFIMLFLHHSADMSVFHTTNGDTAVILLLASQLEKILCNYFGTDSITAELRKKLRAMVDTQQLQPHEYDNAVRIGERILKVFYHNLRNGGAVCASAKTEANGFLVLDADGTEVPNSGIKQVAGYPKEVHASS